MPAVQNELCAASCFLLERWASGLMSSVVPEICVTIPQALREFSGGEPGKRSTDLCLHAHDVRELLAELAREYPQVYVRLCDERGDPRPHINVFVNNDHVRARAGLETPLTQGDRVMILPAVSGG